MNRGWNVRAEISSAIREHWSAGTLAGELNKQ
jgi:hypothetical protein